LPDWTTYMDNLTEKIKLDYLTDFFSLDKNNVAGMDEIKNLSDFNGSFSRLFIEKPDKYMKQLEISNTELWAAKTYNRLNELIESRIDKHTNTLFKEPKFTVREIPSKLEDYIGMEVRLYPGGNPEGTDYDAGGDIQKVPAGSKGVVALVYNAKQKKLVVEFKGEKLGSSHDLQCPQLKGKRSWFVILREIKPINGFTDVSYNITDKYNIKKEIETAVFSRDYNALLDSLKSDYISVYIQQLDSLNRDIGRLSSFLYRFNDSVKKHEEIKQQEGGHI